MGLRDLAQGTQDHGHRYSERGSSKPTNSESSVRPSRTIGEPGDTLVRPLPGMSLLRGVTDIQYTRRGRQYDCLEMSLESGLAKLEHLTLLRELNLSFLETRVKPTDARWMSEHWPRLRVIHGLGVNQKAVRWFRENCRQITVEDHWDESHDSDSGSGSESDQL